MIYDNLPPYSEDNDSELYSMDSFKENWKDFEDKDLPFGTAVTREIGNYVEKRNQYANASHLVHKDYEPADPYFVQWTLYDPVQHRAYASFIDEKDILDFIESDAFVALWQRIDMDRCLSLSEKELNDAGYRTNFLSKPPVFKRREYELYPNAFDRDADTECGVPSKWQIKSVTAGYLSVAKRKFSKLNPEWEEQKDGLPF